MNIAIILVVVIVVGVAGYFLVTLSQTAAPIAMGDRAAVAVVQAPGDVKAVIDGAAAKAVQAASLASVAPISRLSLVTGG